MRTRALVALLFALPLTALAQAPAKLGYQGRLLRSDGAPESGVVQLRFSLFALPTGGSALWEEEQAVALADGFYSTVLGETAPIPGAIFDGTDLFLEVSANGQPFSPRMRVASVPYALASRVAKDLKGGSVEATSISVGGKPVIGSDGQLLPEAAATALDGLTDQLALSEAGTINAEGNPVDWTKLKNVPAGFADGADDGLRTVAVSSPLLGDGASNPLGLSRSSASSDGYLSSADFSLFSSKAAGDHTHPVASASATGLLSSSDWSAFSAKAAADHGHPAASASATGFLTAADWARFDAKVGSVKAGAGLEVTGTIDPAISVKFGTTAGTVARGDDSRFQGMAHVVKASKDDLADGQTLEVDTGTGDAQLVAQAWYFDSSASRWLPVGEGGSPCTTCGNGADGVFAPQSNTALVGKTWNFSKVAIPAGVTVTVTGNDPLVILATESVTIEGALVLDGGAGSNVSDANNGCLGGQSTPGTAGPGGFAGGYGVYSTNTAVYAGQGPGGGGAGTYNWNGTGCGSGGGGGGHGATGVGVSGGGAGGSAYGSVDTGVLRGGSGGGAGGYGSAYNATGAGGGGGGGAVRIDSPRIVVKGRLSANGGKGGDQLNDCDGGASGGGAGGAIWLRGTLVNLTGGTVTATGGAGGALSSSINCGTAGGAGAVGRIRIDSPNDVAGTTSPSASSGDPTGLSPIFAKLNLYQPQAGKVALKNESGQTLKVRLAATY